jgi:branched-chain amino acid transport system substrate-binding protein
MKNLYKLTLVGLIALIIGSIGVFTLTGCKKGPDVYKIGAIVFLTGPQASLGAEVKNALTVASDEINEKGGIKGKKLEILYQDSKDSPKDAIMAFNKLTMEKLPVMISTGDVVSLNLAPSADEKKIPIVATVAAGPDIPKKSDWVFRVFIQVDRQARTMADYAHKELGLKSVAVLYINNEYGVAAYTIFKDNFEKLGGRVTNSETYGIMDRNIRSQITKLKGGNPEAIYVAGFGEGYGACIKQIRELKFNGLILSDNTLSIPYFQQQTTPANEGAYFTSTLYDEKSEVPLAANFIKKYREKFGSDPGFIGAFAYDALRLIATAIEKGGYSSKGIRKTLLSIKNYEGIVGKISFTEDRDLEFPLVVKKIEKGKANIVSKEYY